MFYKFTRECFLAMPCPIRLVMGILLFYDKHSTPTPTWMWALVTYSWNTSRVLLNRVAPKPYALGGHVIRIAASFDLNVPSKRFKANDEVTLVQEKHLRTSLFIFLNLCIGAFAVVLWPCPSLTFLPWNLSRTPTYLREMFPSMCQRDQPPILVPVH